MLKVESFSRENLGFSREIWGDLFLCEWSTRQNFPSDLLATKYSQQNNDWASKIVERVVKLIFRFFIPFRLTGLPLCPLSYLNDIDLLVKEAIKWYLMRRNFSAHKFIVFFPPLLSHLFSTKSSERVFVRPIYWKRD